MTFTLYLTMNHLWQFWKLHKTYNKCFFKLLTVINHKFHTKTKQGPISRKYYINPNYFLPFHSQNVCKTCNTICTGILQDKWIWTNIILSSLFVRRLSSVNISHFHLLLRNHWTNCNQTLVEWSLDGPLSNFFMNFELLPILTDYAN